MPLSFFTYAGRVHFRWPVVALALTSVRSPRAAMLLGGAGEIGTATVRHGPAPDDLLAPLHGGSEDLVFQIAVVETGVLSQAQHLARLGQRAGERLLAGHGDDLRL